MVTAEFVADLIEKPTVVRITEGELAKRKEARKMIESIQAAVASYMTANENKLPAALTDLTQKPAEGEPLLKELPVDPWGNQYQFEPSGDTYVVLSHGADGAAVGDAENQDVRSDQLPMEDALVTAAGEWTTYDGKIKTGEDEAASLTKRFGPWYYVIDKSLFDKLKPSRADLVTKKAEDPKPEDGKPKDGKPKDAKPEDGKPKADKLEAAKP
ncbi:MAG TPA: hypothetical protein EYP98_16000, partial [Planctomycetes bacterium]|nr:hypothetical protein [Planctomycetota bacterium]